MFARNLAVPALLIAAVLWGCGSGGGVHSGETVSVYLSAPLHGRDSAAGRRAVAAAKRALSDAGGTVGGLGVSAVVLDDTRHGVVSPVRIAANARRATEDTTAVAYIGELTPDAAAVSAKVADLAELLHASPVGAAQMTKVLAAIRDAGSSGDQRQAVRDAYGG